MLCASCARIVSIKTDNLQSHRYSIKLCIYRQFWRAPKITRYLCVHSLVRWFPENLFSFTNTTLVAGERNRNRSNVKSKSTERLKVVLSGGWKLEREKKMLNSLLAVRCEMHSVLSPLPRSLSNYRSSVRFILRRQFLNFVRYSPLVCLAIIRRGHKSAKCLSVRDCSRLLALSLLLLAVIGVARSLARRRK